MLLRGFFALQFDLQGQEILAATQGDFQLPGGLQVAIGGGAGLFQAGQLMALQARYGRSGQAQQMLKVTFAVLALQQARGQGKATGMWPRADLAEHAQGIADHAGHDLGQGAGGGSRVERGVAG
ncbi:hypothetical protein D3C76_1394790 [compost metagenome]